MWPILVMALVTAATPSAPVALSSAELDAFQQKYAEHRLNVIGWSGNFHQETHSPDLLAPITSAGNLTYRSPATLEMNYLDPAAGQVWARDGNIGQKFTGRAPQVAAASLVVSLLDFFRQPPGAWKNDFAVAAERENDLVRIKLNAKPGATTTQPGRIAIEVNATTLDPMRLEIDFTDQASLAFTFTDWKSLGSAPAPTPPPPPGHDPALASSHESHSPPPRSGLSPPR